VVVRLPRLQTVSRCSSSLAPYRYSVMVRCDDGLQVRMKLPPAAWMASATG
jgi:hypothetical protein